MSARNCCKTMEMELTAWKAIVYDISRKMQNSPGDKKESVAAYVADLHILVAEMDERIEMIRNTCSPDTGMEDIKTERERYDHSLVNIRMKANDAMQVLSVGDFGG